jgi:hypothetical protein
LFDGSLENAKSLLSYVDADDGQDLSGRKSTTSYVFTLGGGYIKWRSTLQKCISQPTTKAKYIAAAEGAKKAIWLEKLITEIGLQHNSEAPGRVKGSECPHRVELNLYCNSQSAIHLAIDQVMDSRVKHIYIQYHFFRHAVAEKMFELVKIDGKFNPADAFTKVIHL